MLFPMSRSLRTCPNVCAGSEAVFDISTEELRAELLKRVREEYDKPECGSTGARGSYNTSLHVAALVLILVLSTAGWCKCDS